jgi:hypothetical protein
VTDRPKGPASYFPSIEAKYGRSIDEWMSILASSNLTGHKQLVDWLKDEYGLGHGHATALVAYHLDPSRGRGSPPD